MKDTIDIKKVYDAHSRRLYNISLMITGSSEDAEEVMHDSQLQQTCKINTRDFIATDVMLELSGACSAAVYADKSLKYSVSMTSKLTYYGNAVLTNLEKSSNVVKGN